MKIYDIKLLEFRGMYCFKTAYDKKINGLFVPTNKKLYTPQKKSTIMFPISEVKKNESLFGRDRYFGMTFYS